MAKIGTLTADLHLETAAFLRDMRRAGTAVATETAKMRRSMRALETAGSKVQRSFSQLRTGIAAVAGALAIRQFATWAQDALRFADEIQNVADVTGLATDQLQALQAAGQLVGLEVDKTNRGLSFFTKALGQARAGTGPLVGALKNTNKGLLEQIRASISTADALEIYLRHLSGVADASTSARLATAAFGKEGTRFSGIARESGGSLASLIDRFREYLILEPQLVSAGDRIGDNLGQLSQAFRVGFARGVITELSGLLQTTQEQFKSAAEVGQRFGQAVGASLKVLSDAAQFAARHLREIAFAFAALAAMKVATLLYGAGVAMVGLARAAILTAKAVVSIGTAIKTMPAGRLIAIGAALAASALAVVGLEKATANLGPELLQITQALDKLNLSAPPAADGTNALNDAFSQGSAAASKFSQALTAINQQTIAASQLQAANSAVQGYLEAIPPLQQYQLEIQRLIALQAQGAITAAQFGQAQAMAAATAIAPWLQVAGTIGQALGTLFEDNKAVAIAQAIINTLQGITAAIAQYPPPLSYAMAAAQAALGFAQVAKIKSTQPGGGGGGGKGKAKGFLLGGLVPGSGLGDKVPAMLEPREFVVNQFASRRFRPLLEEINSSPSRFQTGGSVGGGTVGGGSLGNTYVVSVNGDLITDDLSRSRFVSKLMRDMDRAQRRSKGRRAF